MDEFDSMFAEKKRFDWIGFFILVAILGFFGFWFVENSHRFGFKFGDDQQQIDDYSTDGATLVFVLELKSKTIDQDIVLRGMSDFVVERKLSGFRALDLDVSDAKPFVEFSESKNVKLPAMFLVVDHAIKKASAFPANRKELEEFCK
jgi:hypothetical protein